MNPNLIFEGIRDGNKESFKQLFHLYYDSLVIYAEEYLADRASSEDVVQEVFIYLWENATSINITTSVKGYLYKMVRNKGLNYLKKLKITDTLETLEYTAITEPFFIEEDLLEEKEKTMKLEKALAHIETMPERMKEVFNLKYKYHYSYSEISSKMGISINTIKTQLRRAKALLQRQIPFYFFLLFLLFA